MAQQRIGLAMSGGGFRASLFHLGVLARMAELDLLRDVELISTVSGGSILGALYYLRLQELLETKPDQAIEKDDYVRAVNDVITEFLAGVQRNVRMRAYASPRAALRMAFRRDYTRSDRLAEIYDELFYRPAAERVPSIRGGLATRTGRCRVRLADLLVRPFGSDEESGRFDPKKGNESRKAKVPMLFVNATTLNTGRRWLFTPSWVGEELESRRQDDPDVNAILHGFYLAAAPQKYRDLPLAVAVAASAGVPGLFAPMPLTDVYDGWLPQLVDGGARDNLGISDLRRLVPDLKLDYFVVSDASDPMSDRREPWPLKVPVLARTAFIMWDRLHDQTVEAASREGDPVIHTRASVEAPVIEPRWVTNREAPAVPAAVPGGSRKPPIAPEVATAIARIRTDLDTFSDVEADALMGAGYLTAAAELAAHPKVPRPQQAVAQGAWIFSWITPQLAAPTPALMRRLKAARYQLTKVLQIPARTAIDWAFSPATAAALPAKGGKGSWVESIGHAEGSALVAGRALGRAGHDLLLRLVTTARDAAVNAVAFPLAVADLAVGDRLFRDMGRRPQLGAKPAAPAPGRRHDGLLASLGGGSASTAMMGVPSPAGDGRMPAPD